MTIDEALERFRSIDGDAASAAVEMLRGFVEDVGPGYLTGDAEQAYERAMLAGVHRPLASSLGPEFIPSVLPEFLNDHLVETFEGDPEEAHSIAEVMGRLVGWLLEQGAIEPRVAKSAAAVARRAADQLPRAMVLGTLLDRQAARVDPGLAFDRGSVVAGLLRIDRVRPGMLWFTDGIGPVPIGEAASRVAQVGWWVDIAVGAKGGFWHILEVGSVYPERVLAEPASHDDPFPEIDDDHGRGASATSA